MIEINEAGDADLADLLRLNVELHEYSARHVPSRLRIAGRYDEVAQRAYVDKVFSDEGAKYLLAADGEAAVGFSEIRMREPEQDPGVVPVRRAYLPAQMVTANRRDEGVGAALLRASEDWARDRGAEAVELDPWIFEGDPGAFYEQAGYAALSRTLTKKL